MLQEFPDIVEVLDYEHSTVGATLIDRGMLAELLYTCRVHADQANFAFEQIVYHSIRQLRTASHIGLGVISELIDKTGVKDHKVVCLDQNRAEIFDLNFPV